MYIYTHIIKYIVYYIIILFIPCALFALSTSAICSNEPENDISVADPARMLWTVGGLT